MPSGDIFKMGQSYEADLLAQARGHARTMQWVAVAAIAMFALCALGLVFMASTHTVTSHVVMVDKATGASEVLAVSGVRDVPAQGIQAMAEVQRYVALRERYNFGILQADYNEVVAKTSEPILQAYSDEITLKGRQEQGRAGRKSRNPERHPATRPGGTCRSSVRQACHAVGQTGGDPKQCFCSDAGLSHGAVSHRQKRKPLAQPTGVQGVFLCGRAGAWCPMSTVAKTPRAWTAFRLPLVVAFSCAAALWGAAHAEIPLVSPTDVRVRYVPYRADAAVTLKVRRGVVTRVVLDKEERILVTGAGFPSNCEAPTDEWCIRAQKDEYQLWIKPRANATHNNLEIQTDKRDYSLKLEVLADAEHGNAPPEEMFRVMFVYAARPAAAVNADIAAIRSKKPSPGRAPAAHLHLATHGPTGLPQGPRNCQHPLFARSRQRHD
jgi:hypothetical protein